MFLGKEDAMGNTSASERQNPVRLQFESLVAALRIEESAAADWLEELRNDLGDIFANEGDEVWENLSLCYYIWAIIDTLERMREGNALPEIDAEAYIQASREWRTPRSPERQMLLHTLEKFTYAPFREFETLLEGAPDENERAKALCLEAFTRLLRMIKLSR